MKGEVDIDIGRVVRGLRNARDAKPLGALARIERAIEALDGLPLAPAYVNGLRDELLQMVTGATKVTHYSASVYLAFYGEEDRARYLKVGVAKDVKSRMLGHLTSNPVPLLWIWAAGFFARPYATEVEGALLRHMSADKIHGEWVSVGGLSQQAAWAVVKSLEEVATEKRGERVAFELWS